MSDQPSVPNINTFEFMFNLYQRGQRNILIILSLVIVTLVGYIVYQEFRYQKTIDKLTVTIEQKEAIEKELADANVILAPIRDKINKGASYILKKHKHLDADAAYRFAYREMVESLNSGMPFVTGLAISGKESEFKPKAVSYTGCCYGIKQIHLRVWSKEKPGLQLEDLYDPDKNIKLGYTILREYFDKTGSVSAALQRYYGSTIPEDNIAYSQDVMRKAKQIEKYINS